MRYFDYSHLRDDRLRHLSQKVSELANYMDTELLPSAETSAGLRHLLEAKDCFVRAALP